ncbi:MAG TPA: C-terminal helicase domain-containing protein, partial [Ktedonobacterales bacterium]|nr:C-terminal helicase domain-containing protein [Ktedonobacterales bacterium]
SQNARERVVAEFRAGQVPVLLATNVAARGLDVLSIEQVINFELPESAELFTHRVGRTGRMEREGQAITLLAQEDLPTWQRMQRELGVRLPPRPWPQATMPLPAVSPAPIPAPQAVAPRALPTATAQSQASSAFERGPRQSRDSREYRRPRPRF